MAEPFQIFVKPAGPVCNLECSYCYYLGKKSLYPDVNPIRMNENTLSRYIEQHIRASEGETIMFSWHGGEPLLAGIDFFRKAVKFQKRFKSQGVTIVNGIQTNGTLLDDSWGRFFQDENFIVGMSLDGPEEYHGKYRMYPSGISSFKKVMKGLEILQKHKIVTEILCVVSSFNSHDPSGIYRFFRQTGVKYFTFLPLVIRSLNSSDPVTVESVGSLNFGEFLSEIFDEWVANDIGNIKIQIIEEALRVAFAQEHTLCIFRQECGRVPVVEFNGDFYSCDHFVDPEHLIGNIMSGSLAELLESERQVAFGRNKFLSLPQYCLNCEVRSMCNGECPKNRFIIAPDGSRWLNYLCTGYRKFFNHCRPFIEAVAEVWKSQKQL